MAIALRIRTGVSFHRAGRGPAATPRNFAARSCRRGARADRAWKPTLSTLFSRFLRTRRSRQARKAEREIRRGRMARTAARHSHLAERQFLRRAAFARRPARRFWRILCRTEDSDVAAIARARRSDPAWQDEHARIRLRHHRRESPFRPVAQSLGAGANFGRIERRIGGGRGHGNGLCLARNGHGRLDPHSFGALRDCGTQADVRLGERGGHRAAGTSLRSRRTDRAQRDGCVHHARGHCREIPARRDAAGSPQASARSARADFDSAGRKITSSTRLDGEVRAPVEAAAKLVSRWARASKKRLCRGWPARSRWPRSMIVAEASAYHESQGYFPRARDRIRRRRARPPRIWAQICARSIISAACAAARGSRSRISQAAFEKVDVILAPTSPIPAPPVGETRGARGGGTRNHHARRVAAAHASGQYHRHARDFDPLRIHAGRPACGTAADRPAMGEARLLAIAQRLRRSDRMAQSPSESRLIWRSKILRRRAFSSFT